MHLDAGAAQELDHALAGDAIEESAVRHRRVNDAILGIEDVGDSELGNLAERIKEDGIIEATLCASRSARAEFG